jgi:3-hydroxyisobutyrate dehydrogenase-like beta-hydroxyacid dehydrogenase
MAMNLLRGGHQLFVHDQKPAALSKLAASGAVVTPGPADVVQRGEVVFTCLPTLAAVEAVYLWEDGLVPNARPGQVLIDLSTVLPSLAEGVHLVAKGRGVATLDAPVSGGTDGAEQGTLTIMVGGEEPVFRQVQELLHLLGHNVIYVGPPGSGNVVKLINQALVVVNHAAVLEAMAMATRTGVDVNKALEVIFLSAGYSRLLAEMAPRILRRDFKPGASVDIVDKDAALVLALARELHSHVPMVIEAKKLYELGRKRGMGPLDIAAMIDLYPRCEVEPPATASG